MLLALRSLLVPNALARFSVARSTSSAAASAALVPAAPRALVPLDSLLPPAIAAWTLLPSLQSLMPSILLVGKSKVSGKNKRPAKAPNHGARPCSHVGRRQRAAAKGRFRFNPKR